MRWSAATATAAAVAAASWLLLLLLQLHEHELDERFLLLFEVEKRRFAQQTRRCRTRRRRLIG